MLSKMDSLSETHTVQMMFEDNVISGGNLSWQLQRWLGSLGILSVADSEALKDIKVYGTKAINVRYSLVVYKCIVLTCTIDYY